MPFVDARSTANEPHLLYYKLLPADVDAEPAESLASRPRVIMIMGLGATHQYWRPQADYFAKFCSVCLLDNRGIGYSDAPRTEWRWTTRGMAKDAIQVLDILGWRHGVHVVGLSMGGMIAQELAISIPHRIASLALVSTYASALHAVPSWKAIKEFALSTGILPADAKGKGMAALRLNFPDKWLHESRSSELHGGKTVSNYRWVRKYSALMATDVPPELKSQGRKPPGLPSTTTLRKQLGAVLTHRISTERVQDLRKHGLVVTVITGDSDDLVRPINAVVLSKMLGVSPKVLEGCGHGLNVQDPERVNTLLEVGIIEGERRWRNPTCRI